MGRVVSCPILVPSEGQWAARELPGELPLVPWSLECDAGAHQKKSKGLGMRLEWLICEQSPRLHRERAVLLPSRTQLSGPGGQRDSWLELSLGHLPSEKAGRVYPEAQG